MAEHKCCRRCGLTVHAELLRNFDGRDYCDACYIVARDALVAQTEQREAARTKAAAHTALAERALAVCKRFAEALATLSPGDAPLHNAIQEIKQIAAELAALEAQQRTPPEHVHPCRHCGRDIVGGVWCPDCTKLVMEGR